MRVILPCSSTRNIPPSPEELALLDEELELDDELELLEEELDELDELELDEELEELLELLELLEEELLEPVQ